MRKVENVELRKLMKEVNVSQWELADAMGKSQSWLSKKLRYKLDPKTESDIVYVLVKLWNETIQENIGVLKENYVKGVSMEQMGEESQGKLYS